MSSMTTDKKIDALNTLAAAFSRASVAGCKTDELAEAILSASKALRAQEEQKKFSPPCYRPDGDSCACLCYDGDDEPIEKCKKCPLYNTDKHRLRHKEDEPCEFCRDDNPKPLDTAEMDAEITQITPFPAIYINTGEKESTADPPFYALRIFWHDDRYCMEDIVPIEFCPKCGRRLVSTRTYESLVAGRERL